jgi:hypothetical protein
VINLIMATRATRLVEVIRATGATRVIKVITATGAITAIGRCARPKRKVFAVLLLESLQAVESLQGVEAAAPAEGVERIRTPEAVGPTGPVEGVGPVGALQVVAPVGAVERVGAIGAVSPVEVEGVGAVGAIGAVSPVEGVGAVEAVGPVCAVGGLQAVGGGRVGVVFWGRGLDGDARRAYSHYGAEVRDGAIADGDRAGRVGADRVDAEAESVDGARGRAADDADLGHACRLLGHRRPGDPPLQGDQVAVAQQAEDGGVVVQGPAVAPHPGRRRPAGGGRPGRLRPWVETVGRAGARQPYDIRGDVGAAGQGIGEPGDSGQFIAFDENVSVALVGDHGEHDSHARSPAGIQPEKRPCGP